MQYVLSLSHGKDSTACIGAIEQLGWPLDRVVHSEVWATDTIPADLPLMVEYKAHAESIIKARWSIEVEHIRAPHTFEQKFYTLVSEDGRPEYRGKPRGWPLTKGSWCLRDLKLPSMPPSPGIVYYVGIAVNETDRHGQLSDHIKSPLVELGWTDADCRRWCEENDLLSPIYTTATRGGCWFCPKQPIEQLRQLRKRYPEYWELMLKWDEDSTVTFHANGHTVQDFDRRFRLEDEGKVPSNRKFRWSMLDKPMDQISVLEYMLEKGCLEHENDE